MSQRTRDRRRARQRKEREKWPRANRCARTGDGPDRARNNGMQQRQPRQEGLTDGS